MTGGPNKKPKYPTVDTAAMAIPAAMVFDLPAKPYAIGTIDETPKPVSKNPIVAVYKFGKSIAVNKPSTIKQPLSRITFLAPVLVTSQSPTNLPVAIIAIKAV